MEPLTVVLKDSDSNVRLSVALALGMIGDASATASLTYALNDEHDEAVCGALETALDMIKKNVMKKRCEFFRFNVSVRAHLCRLCCRRNLTYEQIYIY